jgi:glycosyltransferase involved in cell wall biosynthesis
MYAAMKPLPPWRECMGWVLESEYGHLLRPCSSAEDARVVDELWRDADVVICCERLFDRMRERVCNGRLTFYMSERWLKAPLGWLRVLRPSWIRALSQLVKLSRNKCFHYLSIGVFAWRDMERLAFFGDRMWMFHYPLDSVMERDLARIPGDRPLRVLYAGRMLSLKRPGDVLRGFAIMKKRIPDACLTMLGDGPEVQALRDLAVREGIQDAVSFLPARPMNEVWAEMAASDVFILASSAREGWGVVVNEAMSQGCVVVASRATGAAATMIEDGVNGLLFDTGDFHAMGNLLSALGADASLRVRLSRAARRTAGEWSAGESARRFVAVAEALLNRENAPVYESGPMSRLRTNRNHF